MQGGAAEVGLLADQLQPDTPRTPATPSGAGATTRGSLSESQFNLVLTSAHSSASGELVPWSEEEEAAEAAEAGGSGERVGAALAAPRVEAMRA